MKKFMKKVGSTIRKLSFADLAVIKVLLLSTGALIGAYFSKFFKKLAPLMWIILAVGYAYIIWRLLFKSSKHRKLNLKNFKR